MFKNLMLYRLSGDWPSSAAQLEEALSQEPFAECSASQQQSSGWVSPRGTDHGALAEAVDGQWIARMMIETKPVPSEAVRRKAQETIDEIERRTGRKPGRKEIRDIRDDSLQALLPQAFARRSQITVWIDPETGRMLLDAGSQARADEVIDSLVRVAGKGFGVSLLQTQHTPQSMMSQWLGTQDADTLPANLLIGRECELKGSGEEPAVIRFSRHDLTTDEVRQHVAEGKLPTRLALDWQGRVGFVLTQALELKKITFAEGLFDDAVAQPDDDRFDADVVLATGELRGLIDDLVDALGGEADLGMPAGFTPAPAPTDTSAEEHLPAADDAPF